MQAVYELVDLRRARRGIVFQDIFFDRRAQARRQKASLETAPIRRAGEEAPGSRQNQSFDLLSIVAQSVSWFVRRYAITIFRLYLDNFLPRELDEGRDCWLPNLDALTLRLCAFAPLRLCKKHHHAKAPRLKGIETCCLSLTQIDNRKSRT
jgi:hypothetical protein